MEEQINEEEKMWIIAAVVIPVLGGALLWFFGRKGSGKTLNAGVRTDIGDWAFYDKTHETCYGIEADAAGDADHLFSDPFLVTAALPAIAAKKRDAAAEEDAAGHAG